MLIGIPGSGKSNWLNSLKEIVFDDGKYRLCNGTPFCVICPDDYRKRMGNISDQSVNLQVWLEAKDATREFLEHGTNVILDATNVNTKYRRDFISDLPCKLMAKVFPVSPETAWERVKGDLFAGRDRAQVPEETIYRMYGQFLYTIRVLSSEGFEFWEETERNCDTCETTALALEHLRSDLHCDDCSEDNGYPEWSPRTKEQIERMRFKERS
jgi:predicted kinase